MRSSLRRPLASGALVIATALLFGSRADAQQFSSSHWTAPSANDQTSTDGVFSGTFQSPVDDVKLTLTGRQPPPGCEPTATASQDYPRPAPSPTPPPSRDFSFAEGDLICNGIYDARAEAQVNSSQPGEDPQTVETITLSNITVAVPAKPASHVTAAGKGGGSVAVSWTSGYDGTATPPDFVGYQLYRVDSSHARQKILPRPTTSTSYTDVDVPASGTYTYEVDALRNGAEPATASSPSVSVFLTGPSAGPQQVSPASAGAPGGSPAPGTAGAKSPATPPTAYFGSGATLPQDDLEPGDQQAAPANLPSAGTVRIGRDGSPPGAGLVKPIAAALTASVWAGLFLFLSRRAVRADRSLPANVEVEHVA